MKMRIAVHVILVLTVIANLMTLWFLVQTAQIRATILDQKIMVLQRQFSPPNGPIISGGREYFDIHFHR